LSAKAKAPLYAAVGEGNPSDSDPCLVGIPSHPFFQRNLRYTETMDRQGRIRLTALTIQEG